MLLHKSISHQLRSQIALDMNSIFLSIEDETWIFFKLEFTFVCALCLHSLCLYLLIVRTTPSQNVVRNNLIIIQVYIGQTKRNGIPKIRKNNSIIPTFPEKDPLFVSFFRGSEDNAIFYSEIPNSERSTLLQIVPAFHQDECTLFRIE